MADCCCNGKQTANLIYACSGSANTGLLADQVARRLALEGNGKMTCLAAVGAGLSGFLESARTALRQSGARRLSGLLREEDF
jgi:uncharacterized metal-binding protein